MTVRKLIAIAVIFACTCVAWMILGGANTSRTSSSFSALKAEVVNLYGGSLVVKSPECYERVEMTRETLSDGKRITETYYEYRYADVLKTDARAEIFLDQRKKGNLWFPTFKARFNADYTFRLKDHEADGEYFVFTSLNSAESMYSGVSVTVNGERRSDIMPLVKKEAIPVVPSADGLVTLSVSYGATGMEDFAYVITEGDSEIAQLNDFTLMIKTDFDSYDFPSGMMSPTDKIDVGERGAELSWRLDDAVTGKDIGLVIPNRLNPGEIITRVCFFAPVSLLFFFIVLLMVSIVFSIRLHPMHFFFLAATFFSFHLMFSYFSDQWNIYASFAIAAFVSLALTVSYLSRFTPRSLWLIYAPLTQTVYLVVFSFSFFFDGMTGIIVTVCAVATLFILMQVTAKIDWDGVFEKK